MTASILNAARKSTSSRKSIIDLPVEERFILDREFIDRYIDKQPKWGILGYFVYKRTYARPLPNGSSEEFWQTLERVINGVYSIQKWHCKRNKLPWSDVKAQESAQEMFQKMWTFKFLPPGRGLWAMGSEYVYERGSGALNNCSFFGTEDLAKDFSGPFCTAMDFLMLGVGVGGNTVGAGTLTIQMPISSDDVHVVEDTREGWIELARRILDSYVCKATLPRDIDYSKVRPAGDPIAGFGGTASGPGPLMKLVQAIHDVLSPIVDKLITSEAITDLYNHVGVCVVSGNVRRSAEIVFGNQNDLDFINLKDPITNKQKLMSHRWASNNSLYVDVGSDYSQPASLTSLNGEPGYYWLKNAQAFGRMKDPADWKDYRAKGANPCNEQTLENWELCCLVESFPSLHDSYEEFERTLKFAYLYAKTVTLVPTHDDRVNAVVLRNRRIGCSMSGITQAFKKFGRRSFLNWCDQGYGYISKMDGIYSDWLCIPRSIKKTSVKPSGTVSLLPGVSPGIHYDFAEYYNRAIRVSKTNPLATALKLANYRVEVDVCDPSSYVIYFPVKVENFDKAESEVSLFEQLENAAQIQYYWADNQVSCTAKFAEHEAKDIRAALELYETRLKGISFLPHSHNYEQAPYTKLSKEEYESAISQIRPIAYAEAKIDHDSDEKYCDGESCQIRKK